MTLKCGDSFAETYPEHHKANMRKSTLISETYDTCHNAINVENGMGQKIFELCESIQMDGEDKYKGKIRILVEDLGGQE